MSLQLAERGLLGGEERKDSSSNKKVQFPPEIFCGSETMAEWHIPNKNGAQGCLIINRCPLLGTAVFYVLFFSECNSFWSAIFEGLSTKRE